MDINFVRARVEDMFTDGMTLHDIQVIFNATPESAARYRPFNDDIIKTYNELEKNIKKIFKISKISG